MPDGLHHGQPFGNRFDRSPIDMPPAWVRSLIQRCAAQIRMENMQRGRSFETLAICDGLEEIADGKTRNGCRRFIEAEAHRERGE